MLNAKSVDKNLYDIFVLLLLMLLLIMMSTNVQANSYKEKSFKLASVKTSKANLRYGPGSNYPIKLILTQKQIPLLIIDSYDHWRKVLIQDEISGWLHKSQISSKLTSSVIYEDFLRKKPNLLSRKIAFFKKYLNVSILKCKVYWCKIELPNRKFTGWYIKEYLWGTNYIILK